MSNLIKHSYISSACNRTPNILDWGYNNLICYGACNAIVIWDKQGNFGNCGRVIQTLCRHSERVNCVRWISWGNMAETELISCSTDKTAIVWSQKKDMFYPSAILEGHNETVSVADAIYANKGSKHAMIVATASSDSSLKIWRRFKEYDRFICTQTMAFPFGNICISIRLHYLPCTTIPILACGVSDNNIYLCVDCNNETNTTNTGYYTEFTNIEVLIKHEAWIHGLDFVLDGRSNLYLASSSQDTRINIWKIFQYEFHSRSSAIQSNNKTFSVKLDNGYIGNFTVQFEKGLSGHDSWVYGVHWSPKITMKDVKNMYKVNETDVIVYDIQPLDLLSSSMDRSIILWKYNPEKNDWLESVRVGEVGGNSLGFYGAKFAPTGKSFVGHGYQGSFHMWKCIPDGLGADNWQSDVVLSGHYDEIIDLSWEPQGEFLVSVSADQTTRLHAQWINTLDKQNTWHELARPQVHGYSMSGLAVLSRYKFASGAEEKVIRVFEAPKNFVENFRNICAITSDPEGDRLMGVSNLMPKGASVPSLGLSNMAVFDPANQTPGTVVKKDEYPDMVFTPLCLEKPPTEENLVQNTLWPEIQKLYGHGFEIFSLASTSDGKLLASACKATKQEHAIIILWNTETWQQLQKLMSHTLTITQLAFSPDNKCLLSVSRDRRWSIFEKSRSGYYDLAATTDKTCGVHTRIIWCCAWTHNSKYFLTGSRDGKAVVWSKLEKESNLSIKKYGVVSKVLDMDNNSITAAAFAPTNIDKNKYLLALGFEMGVISIFKWNPTKDDSWNKCITLNNCLAHHLSVKKLAFRPLLTEQREQLKNEKCVQIFQLASGGLDNFIRIYDINMNNL